MKSFIPNIDDANIRIMQLETKLGLKAGGFIDHFDDAHQRVEELEIEERSRRPAAGQPTSSAGQPATSAGHSAVQSAGYGLSGIRRAIAGNGGGIIPPNSSTKPLVRGAGLARAIAANVRDHAAK